MAKKKLKTSDVIKYFELYIYGREHDTLILPRIDMVEAALEALREKEGKND